EAPSFTRWPREGPGMQIRVANSGDIRSIRSAVLVVLGLIPLSALNATACRNTDSRSTPTEPARGDLAAESTPVSRMPLALAPPRSPGRRKTAGTTPTATPTPTPTATPTEPSAGAVFRVRACRGSTQSSYGEIFHVELGRPDQIAEAEALLAGRSRKILSGAL